VYIDGYTDKTGTDLHNDTLSKDRAMAVKNYLVDNGIDASRLKARAHGETLPIDTLHDNSLVNRRVEITLCTHPATE
jgi:outer membrane protein OmpA-like peptidoglycan-associated protein